MPRSIDETATALYRAILRREPSAGELETARNQAAGGEDAADLAARIAGSREAERYRTRLFFPPGHFYSPIVDPQTLAGRIPRTREPVHHPLPDVDLDLERMTGFWQECLAPHARRTPFPVEPDAGFRYHFEAPTFGYGDAITLHAMLRHLRPQRLVEVGCGWSSACTLDTLAAEPRMETEVTFIEPFPELLEKVIWPEDRERIEIIPTPIQDVPVERFRALGRDDVLFIDSTHVVKTGSDVVYELCEVLPSLQPGVVIHFHDIFYPFEYGYRWVMEENRSWNEIYALRNFLAFNEAFEVLFFNDMFAQLRREVLERDCGTFLRNGGGSLWIRRR